MNKKVLFIIFLTAAALILLMLYSFGPLAKLRTAQKINSASTKPTATQTVNVGSQSTAFSVFHNKDVAQNNYSLLFPQDWKVTADKVGGYALSFNFGSGSSELTDIPDNSTLELIVLSQEEPKLKKSLANYSRLGYNKLSVNGSDAYQLVYSSLVNGQPTNTVRTYLAGPDHAVVLMFSAAPQNFNGQQQLFTSILNSFKWEN